MSTAPKYPLPETVSAGEAEEYVFRWCRHLLSPPERDAWLYLGFDHKISNTSEAFRERLKSLQERHYTPESLAYLEMGVGGFRSTVLERLLREHGWSFLNLCPRCGGMARTPRAKQCPKCFFSWHGTDSIAEAPHGR